MANDLDDTHSTTSNVSRTYMAVPGFFLQDDPTAVGIPAIPPRFGLLDESPDRWKHFFSNLDRMNREADGGISFKVIFLGRHGQGFHNVAQEKYRGGTKSWKSYWSKLNADGELVWGPDPELTTMGKGQAVDAQEAWKTELVHGIPLPGKLYVSPMTRALQTCEITFDGLLSNQNKRPIILENCREQYGAHTCDKRRTKTYIAKAFPRFVIENGFTEEDTLWDTIRESKAHTAHHRAKQALDYIFEHDKETFISVTAHISIVDGFLASIGRPAYILPTGGIVPVVVKCVCPQTTYN